MSRPATFQSGSYVDSRLDLLARESAPLLVRSDGFRWTADTGDEIGESIYVEGRYSHDEISAVLAWLGEGDKRTIVDVGANVGTTTLPLARAGTT